MRMPKLSLQQKGGYRRCPCGEYFYYQRCNTNRKYCSRKCFFKHQPRKPKYRFVCKGCEQEFFRDHPRKLDCCSRPCSIRYRRAKFAVRMASRKCDNCKKQLDRTQERFCSRRCCSEYSRARSEALVTCTCTCGKQYKAYRSRLKEGRDSRCSSECAKQYRLKGLTKHCEYCGQDFYVSRSNERRCQNKYCSQDCAAKAKQRWKIFTCRFCGVKFKRRGPHKYMFCSVACTRLAVNVERKVGKRHHPRKIYTPELLRMMSRSTKPTCSFPSCDDSQPHPKNLWNACARHARKIKTALHEANKRRLRVLVEHGLQPV